MEFEMFRQMLWGRGGDISMRKTQIYIKNIKNQKNDTSWGTWGGGYFYGGVQISLLDSMSFGPDYIYSHQI